MGPGVKVDPNRLRPDLTTTPSRLTPAVRRGYASRASYNSIDLLAVDLRCVIDG